MKTAAGGLKGPRPPTPSRPVPTTPPPATPSQPQTPSSPDSPAAPRPTRPTRKAPTPGGAQSGGGSTIVPPTPLERVPLPPARANSQMELLHSPRGEAPKPTPPPRTPPPQPATTSMATNGNGHVPLAPTKAPVPPRPSLNRKLSSSDTNSLPNTNGNGTLRGDESPRPGHGRAQSTDLRAGSVIVPKSGGQNSFRNTPPPVGQNGSLRGGVTSMGGSPTSPAPIGAAGPSDGGGEEEDDIASWDDMDQPPIRTDFQSMRKLDDDPQRANIVLEIMKTEEDYINNVEQMIKNYKGPLVTLAMTHPEFNPEEMRMMFSNIHLILPLNQELLKDISARIDNWSPTQKLGDIFVKMAPFLKMYTDYSNNYKQAMAIYNKFNTESEKFAETCALCKATCKPNRNLESFLINPIQRIPRYNLLLSELLKHTPPSHPDHDDLTRALATMKEVATHINLTVKKTDNLRKLAQQSTKGTGFKGLMKAHRQLLRDGMVPTVDNKGHKEKLHFFLFNDLLVHANKSDVKKHKDMTKVNGQWPINLVWFSPSMTGFEITGPNRIFTISQLQPDEVEAWVADFKKCLEPFESDKREGVFDFGPMKYEGEWLRGKIHGSGTLTSFGTTYTGQFSQGKKAGEGTLQYTTNDVYAGNWGNDLQNGHGVLTLTDGSQYTGEWKDGKKHGHGTFVFANGDQYVGGWRDDLSHGEGKLYLACGVSYEGQWERGKFHGKGKLILPNGKTYVGDFVEGLKEGNGVLDYGNGEQYEGSWKQDKRHGQGTHTIKDGWETKYTGSWAGDRKEGNGSMTYLDGSHYEGGWKNDTLHEKGVLTKANGDVYTGHFKLGVPHGAGVLTFAASGMEFKGKWENGVRDSGKVTMSRVLTEEEKKIVQANPKGNHVLDKLEGKFNPKECTVSCSFNGDPFDVAVIPEVPNFNLNL